jgi:hypothetical protein
MGPPTRPLLCDQPTSCCSEFSRICKCHLWDPGTLPERFFRVFLPIYIVLLGAPVMAPHTRNSTTLMNKPPAHAGFCHAPVVIAGSVGVLVVVVLIITIVLVVKKMIWSRAQYDVVTNDRVHELCAVQRSGHQSSPADILVTSPLLESYHTAEHIHLGSYVEARQGVIWLPLEPPQPSTLNERRLVEVLDGATISPSEDSFPPQLAPPVITPFILKFEWSRPNSRDTLQNYSLPKEVAAVSSLSRPATPFISIHSVISIDSQQSALLHYRDAWLNEPPPTKSPSLYGSRHESVIEGADSTELARVHGSAPNHVPSLESRNPMSMSSPPVASILGLVRRQRRRVATPRSSHSTPGTPAPTGRATISTMETLQLEELPGSSGSSKSQQTRAGTNDNKCDAHPPIRAREMQRANLPPRTDLRSQHRRHSMRRAFPALVAKVPRRPGRTRTNLPFTVVKAPPRPLPLPYHFRPPPPPPGGVDLVERTCVEFSESQCSSRCRDACLVGGGP